MAEDSSKGHPAHVSSRSGPDTRSGMRPVIRARPSWEGSVTSPRFPAAFRLPPLASWPSCSRHGFPPSLRSAYRRLVSSAGPDGVPMFHTSELRPVSGASCTPGPWCSRGQRGDTSHHCRLPAAGPVPQSCYHPPEAVTDEACRDSPTFALSGLPLAGNQRMAHRSLGFLPGFTPHRYQRRMPGAGTSVEHSLGPIHRS